VLESADLRTRIAELEVQLAETEEKARQLELGTWLECRDEGSGHDDE
jgi:hypothetical protein